LIGKKEMAIENCYLNVAGKKKVIVMGSAREGRDGN
jgi:hypothetical protein